MFLQIEYFALCLPLYSEPRLSVFCSGTLGTLILSWSLQELSVQILSQSIRLSGRSGPSKGVYHMYMYLRLTAKQAAG